jgi:hypothetical protein
MALDPLPVARFAALAAALKQSFPDPRLTLTYLPPLGVHAVWSPAPSAAEQSQYDALVAGWDWSQAAQDAYDLSQSRALAQAALSQADADHRLLRAVLLALLDQLNVIRAALVPPLPPVTVAQALTAVRAKANSAAAD